MPLSQGGCVCPGCSADLDELGDHALSCKRLGVYSRHNAIRNVLASLFLDAGFRTELEQPKHASDRLADVLVHGFDGDTPLAIDVCVSHVLQSSMPLAAVQTGSVACLAEYRKSQESLAICKARGWNFAPFIGETLGGWGPVARQLVSRLAKFVSLKTGTPYAETAASVWSTLTSAMVYAVSRQLERAYGDVSAPPDNQPVPSGNPGSSSLNSCPMQIQSFPGDFVTSTPDTTNLSTAPAPPAAPLQTVPTPLPADGAANGQSMLNEVDVSEMSTDSPASDPSPPPAHPRAQSLPLGVADALDDAIMKCQHGRFTASLVPPCPAEGRRRWLRWQQQQLATSSTSHTDLPGVSRSRLPRRGPSGCLLEGGTTTTTTTTTTATTHQYIPHNHACICTSSEFN